MNKVENYCECSNTKAKLADCPSKYEQKRTAAKQADCLSKYEQKRIAALEGNGREALCYGLDLMCGVWDLQRMEEDLARDQLKEPEKSSSSDPYILLEKNPVEGLKFLQMATTSTDLEHAKLAKFFMAFCQKNGLAGLSAGEEALVPLRGFHNNICVLRIEKCLKREAKSAALVAGSPFVPTQMIRPKVDNPNKALFKKLGQSLLQLQFIPILMAQLVAFAPLSTGPFYKQTLWASIASFLFISLPILIYTVLIRIYAINRGLPVCSCVTMRETNSSIQQTLRPDCQQKENPFIKTPFVVRNLFVIKKFWFWLLAAFSLAISVFSLLAFHRLHKILAYLKFEDLEIMFIPLRSFFTFILSVVTLMLDLNSKLADEQFFLIWYKSLLSPFANHHYPCQKVHDEIFNVN
jgi:hypothetical protein